MQKENLETINTLEDSEEGQEIATESDQTVDLQNQLDAMKEKWLRAEAELENFRIRARKEKEDAHQYAASGFARDVILILDNIERAITSQSPGNISVDDLPKNVQDLIKGIEMVSKEAINVFEKHGIKQIDAKFKAFDPAFHQAVFEVETSDNAPGTVVQILQQGYLIKDRVLRPAMVGVAKAPASENATETNPA